MPQAEREWRTRVEAPAVEAHSVLHFVAASMSYYTNTARPQVADGKATILSTAFAVCSELSCCELLLGDMAERHKSAFKSLGCARMLGVPKEFRSTGK